MWDYREGVFKDTQWSINVFQHGNGSTTARISNVICFLYNLHDGSHFKPIQKWASKKIWRRFPSSFKRICHAIFSQMSPQFLCRKNFRENRNSALNHEKTFFTILWSNLENAESLKWSLTLEIMIVIINQLCLYCSASPVDFLWPQNTVCCQIVNISKVHLIGSSF